MSGKHTTKLSLLQDRVNRPRSVFITAVLLSLVFISKPVCGEDDFHVPEPELLEQALQEGLLSEEDYLRLLEISRTGVLTRADSLFVMQFPDILTGTSLNPILQVPDSFPLADETESTGTRPIRIRGSCLYRQYNRLTEAEDFRSVYRLDSEFGSLHFRGEIDRSYADRRKWLRRSLEFESGEISRGAVFRAGNFTEQFGLGAVYGYHGRLLRRSGDEDLGESFSYPSYGGTNGIEAVLFEDGKRLTALLDFDRNSSHSARFAGASLEIDRKSKIFSLTAGFGSIENSANNTAARAIFLAGRAGFKLKKQSAECELSVALHDNRQPISLIVEAADNIGKNRITFTGWHYDMRYPSWFSGGPSARRYRTLHLDEINLAYSDRFAGETGGALKSRHHISRAMAIDGAILYANRSDDEYILEMKGRLSVRLAESQKIYLDCYEKRYGIYSDDQVNRKVQLQHRIITEAVRISVSVGGKFDPKVPVTYLAASEVRLKIGPATCGGSTKFDRINMDGLYAGRTYVSIWTEARPARHFSTHIHYSCNYYRGSASGPSATLRWDLTWLW
jgi:hypothetical protein